MTANPKRKPIRSKSIRQSANGEACAVCGINDGTTVFCHLNESWAGKSMGRKAEDIAGFFGCSTCHSNYDQHRLWEDEWLPRSMYRTWCKLIEKGIIKIIDHDQ